MPNPSVAEAVDVAQGVLAKFSEDQPRDDHGRWTTGGDAVDGDRVQLEKNLASFTERYRNAKIEHMNAYDHAGNLMDSNSGTSNQVTIDRISAVNTAVLIHNHPTDVTMQGSIGGSLSIGDVAAARELKAHELRAIDEKYTYVMQPTEFGQTPETKLNMGGNKDLPITIPAITYAKWPSILDVREQHDAAFKQANRELSADVQQRRLTMNEAQDELQHRIWTYAAPKLGLRYERREE